MAYFKDPKYFHQEPNAPAYDQLHHPGVATPYSGIYRCEVCGHEADSTKGKPLPPEHHPHNLPHQKTRWRLIAAAHPANR